MGKYTWDNGDVYDGMWENGRRTMTCPWANGRQSGIMTYNRDVYDGEWKNDDMGENIWDNGDVYDGMWENVEKGGNNENLYISGGKRSSTREK